MISRVCALDRAIRNQLHTQHGITTHAQLLDAGFSPDKIHRWVNAGHLIRVHRGVYAVGHLPPSPHARTMAALLACGPHAVLSHRSAAKLWGLIRYHGPIEVTAPNTRRRAGIIVHRHRLSDHDVTRHWDIPVTTPARTLTDLAPVLTAAALTRAINDARLNGHLSLDDLPSKLRAGQTPRPTRSVFEDTFLRFLDRYDLPRPEVNTIVAGHEVDMLWHPQRLIAELDGREFHEIDFEADREQDADLLTHGYRVIRVTWERLTQRTVKEAERFKALLARPAPPRGSSAGTRAGAGTA
jgi:very-short-patch-repair endonuclease